MKLEVGMYVRTKEGTIRKYSAQDILYNNFEDNYYFTYDTELYDDLVELVVKASHNIIDLIEVGDYVLIENSERYQKVVRVLKECNVADKCIQLSTHNYKYHYNNHIKGIVTKEQFESMSYKVGE